ncbi:MAG: heterodisulfide reductase-related iron-sulfur binding cluster, partial [Ktedonobacterales bacterium]
MDTQDRSSQPASDVNGADSSSTIGPEPAHVVAAAQAAGESSPSAGALAVGAGSMESATQMTQPIFSGNGSAKPVAFRRAFDDYHAPDPELIADCVHCGFCLPTCPTYLLWGEEMDSPRGRIQLMKMASQGEIGMTERLTRHMDQCLGCMACVTACPSGVQYDKLIEATRAQIDRRYERGTLDRLFRSLVFQLFPRPNRLRAMLPLLWLYQRCGAARLLESSVGRRVIPARLRGMASVLPAVDLGAMSSRTPAYTAAHGTKRRARVGVLLGCVQRVFFDDVNAATIRVLAAEGYDVVAPEAQGCCGALSFHSGREGEGLEYARRLIDEFEWADVERIIVNVAGCGSSLKEYGHLLRDDLEYAERARAFSAKVRDVAEFLAEMEPQAPRHPINLRVAYHDACHLSHAQGIRRQPRAVLRQIPGIEIVDIPEGEICCGSAGTYNLLQPQAASELGERKAR